MKFGSKVKVYTDDVVGWEDATLIEQYQIVSEGSLERWRIETSSGTTIVRYVKDSKELKKDGCAYLQEENKFQTLYEFLEAMYNQCSFNHEIDFDKYIEGFLCGSFGVDCHHEAFWFSNDYLFNFIMDYEIDHVNKQIKLLFKNE